jgi:hypothetical protein
MAADLERVPITPPPRTIADVRTLLGSERLVPSNCPRRQAERRASAEEWRAALEELRGQYEPHPKAWVFTSFQVLDLAERSFDLGDYRLATEFVDSGLGLSRRVREWRPSVGGRVQDVGEAGALYEMLMHAALARIYATTGDAERAKVAVAAVERLYGDARRSGWWGRMASGSRVLARAYLDHLAGELGSAEAGYRHVLENTHWYRFGSGEIDLAWMGARLTALLRQQDRLLESELVARTTVKDAWLTYRYSDAQARVGQPANELAAVLLEKGCLEEAAYVGRMAVNFYEADCAEPGSLPLVLARRTLVRIRAASGDWAGVNALLAKVRGELAADEAAFVRLYGLDPEPGLALVESGRRE